MDKMREEYEAWINRQGYFWLANKDAYWEVWQRSRAALCVKLPRQTYDYDLDCDTMIAHHVGKALDAAGVRYK